MLLSRDELAAVKTYLGLALMAAADTPGATPEHRIAGFSAACPLLNDAVAVLDEVKKVSLLDRTEEAEYREGLTRCRAELNKLGVR